MAKWADCLVGSHRSLVWFRMLNMLMRTLSRLTIGLHFICSLLSIDKIHLCTGWVHKACDMYVGSIYYMQQHINLTILNSPFLSLPAVIFPDDIEFRKVKACTTGRVFILKFKSSSRKMFFWMQEPKAEKGRTGGFPDGNLLSFIYV